MLRIVMILMLVAGLGQTATAQQARQMLNGMRAEQGLGAVKPSARLEQAAMAHAMDMSRNGFFAHKGSDGSNVMKRVRRTGYGPCVVAENIGKGQPSLTAIMGAWAASPSHRKNMLNQRVTEYGLVKAPGNYWVMVLGKPGCRG
ncbi:MAG: CAP domain-containing protein [Pelagimonas sp.]|uniref:CAP domain-containing protein n=1 Tax=Pelagimonas sp. TaxID=2073170 RepID=UPI003D6C005B